MVRPTPPIPPLPPPVPPMTKEELVQLYIDDVRYCRDTSLNLGLMSVGGGIGLLTLSYLFYYRNYTSLPIPFTDYLPGSRVTKVLRVLLSVGGVGAVAVPLIYGLGVLDQKQFKKCDKLFNDYPLNFIQKENDIAAADIWKPDSSKPF
jgi:hypothetical protein